MICNLDVSKVLLACFRPAFGTVPEELGIRQAGGLTEIFSIEQANRIWAPIALRLAQHLEIKLGGR
jgi:hypothetical protein